MPAGSERDYDEYGYEFGTPGTRLADLAAAMPVIENRWAVLNPPPLAQDPGADRRRGRSARPFASWRSTPTSGTASATPTCCAHKLGVLREHGEAVGRDTSEIEISTEIRRRTESDADALVETGASLFTLGITAPEFNFDAVKRWLAWRDARNRG